MADYTDVEKQQIRSAAFGAVALVSRAEPGAFDTIKETFAASKVLAKAPREMQDMILRAGGMPKVPSGEQSQLEATVLSDLNASVQTISAKDPSHLNTYQRTVMDACMSAAEAGGGGVQPSETTEMAKIMSALGMSPNG